MNKRRSDYKYQRLATFQEVFAEMSYKMNQRPEEGITTLLDGFGYCTRGKAHKVTNIHQ